MGEWELWAKLVGEGEVRAIGSWVPARILGSEKWETLYEDGLGETSYEDGLGETSYEDGLGESSNVLRLEYMRGCSLHVFRCLLRLVPKEDPQTAQS